MTHLLLDSREARSLLTPLTDAELDDDRVRLLTAAATWSCIVEPGDGAMPSRTDRTGMRGRRRG
jgi:hypothetical protein